MDLGLRKEPIQLSVGAAALYKLKKRGHLGRVERLILTAGLLRMASCHV